MVRPKQCAYCGSSKHLTDDHVPPKNPVPEASTSKFDHGASLRDMPLLNLQR